MTFDCALEFGAIITFAKYYYIPLPTWQPMYNVVQKLHSKGLDC